MEKSHELVPNIDIIREKTRNGSMKIFEDMKKGYIRGIANEMRLCAEAGMNKMRYYPYFCSDGGMVKDAFEAALEEFKKEGYIVNRSVENDLSVSVTISWPLDL